MARISYLSGPANFPQIFAFQQGGAKQTFFGTNYMKLFIDFVKQVAAKAQVVTWVGETANFRDESGQFELVNRPMTMRGGLRYHADMVGWNLAILRKMMAYKPDVLLLTGAQDYWWIYAPLVRSGTKVIASFHCVQWPVVGEPPFYKRLYAKLNAALVLRSASAILVTSKAIRDQVKEMMGPGSTVPIIDHLPTYDARQFQVIEPPAREKGAAFEVLFVGRIEENKGVFDLVGIARELAAERPGEFRFHLCGEGSRLTQLKAQVAQQGLQDVVTIYGHCDTAQLSRIMDQAHACVVPTRSDFEAGFEMTCAEAILADRPLVTSRVCPALDYLRPATIEVPPDDVKAYKQAIVSLADDPVLYASKRAACAGLKEQFFDPANSWTTALRKAWSLAGLS